MRPPVRVPVIGVAGKVEPRSRHELGDAERSGSGRLRREFYPVAAELGMPARADHQQKRKLVRRHRIGRFGNHRDGPGIDLLRTYDARHAGTGHAGADSVELRRLAVEYGVEIPHRRVGVETRTIMEHGIGSQLDDPAPAVRRIGLPCGREPGHQRRGAGIAQVPIDQRVVDRIAREAQPLEAAIRAAPQPRNIEERDRNPQGRITLRECRRDRTYGATCGGTQQQLTPRPAAETGLQTRTHDDPFLSEPHRTGAKHQWVSNTAWYAASLPSSAPVSCLVGWSGSRAGGSAPNFIRQASSSIRALVAVRLRPVMKGGTAGVKPSLLPRPTRATGMPE